jgi:ribonuclease D
VWIDEPDKLTSLCREAIGGSRVAVDTEADSFHSYHHKLCLIQLSSGGAHAVIDPLRLGRRDLRPLAALLGDGGVAKLMHGADYDLRVLDRDLDAHVVNLRDTQVAAQLLGEPQTGLAPLLEKELGVFLDKSLQRADWSRRPLPGAYLAYAAADTAYLGRLAARLEQRLRVLGRVTWWEEECEALEGVRYEAPAADPYAFERIKGARQLRGEARDRLAALYEWRDRTACAADVAPFRVLRSETLLLMAQQPPSSLSELSATRGVGGATVRRHGRELLALLAAPPPAPEWRRGRRPPADPERDRRMRELRAIRDEAAAELGLDAGVVAPRQALEAVVEVLPRDAEDLRRSLERRWRAEVLGERVLKAVQGWCGGSNAGPH